jgi:phosphatidylglycerophosphate synthase
MADTRQEEKPAVGTPARSEGYRAVVRRLSSAQKPAPGAPAYSRYINRRLGRYLAAAAYRAGLTPNQVTALSALCSAVAIAILATVQPAALTGVLVTFLFLLGYALDSADGQLARLRGTSSMSGEWLDHMVDAAKISSMHLAVLIGWYRFGRVPSERYLLIPIAFCLVTAVLFFGMTLNDQLRRVKTATTGVPAGPRPDASRLRSMAVIGTDFGVVCAAFVLWGWQDGFLVVYSALLAVHVAFLALASVKWFRDMKALDPASG